MDAIQAYRKSEISGDNPVHLVVLLYDQLLRDLRRALDAVRQGDVERRCTELDHALVVLAQLQGTLDLDGGGEVAQNLDHFYALIRNNLLRAGSEGNPELLEKQWQQILAVREAWLEVERESSAPAESAPHHEAQTNPKGAEWKA